MRLKVLWKSFAYRMRNLKVSGTKWIDLTVQLNWEFLLLQLAADAKAFVHVLSSDEFIKAEDFRSSTKVLKLTINFLRNLSEVCSLIALSVAASKANVWINNNAIEDPGEK